jgi:Zn-finger in ubiquitin-hydrolases and other protein
VTDLERYGRLRLMTDIDPTRPPSGTGCADCDAATPPGWWLHLRRCATCGHIGCCDDSLARHATAHYRETGHPIIQSFEPGEDWFYDYRTDDFTPGPELAPPHSHPVEQGVPGPVGRVPDDWARLLG